EADKFRRREVQNVNAKFKQARGDQSQRAAWKKAKKRQEWAPRDGETEDEAEASVGCHSAAGWGRVRGHGTTAYEDQCGRPGASDHRGPRSERRFHPHRVSSH